ncbi:MAG TPA: hypothetical protein VHG08_27395 [Longimicrobium sp.]|nr:hypothetical protein [Longimicrobium sp.]
MLDARWNAPADVAATGYVVTLQDEGGALVEQQLLATAATTASFVGKASGQYTVAVRALAAGGYGAEASSAVATLTAAAASPSRFPPPVFPPFSSDPLLLLDAGGYDPAALRKRLAAAVATGTKWRYEYLREQALRMAQDALGYEAHITSLMQMALTKMQTAQLLASPVLQTALSSIEGDTQELRKLAGSASVEDLVRQLAREASTAMLLQAILAWLVVHEPLEFWIGLFDRMVDDVSNADMALPRTGGYLEDVYEDTEFGDAIQAAAHDLRAEAARQIDDMAAPLRSAVAQVVAETSKALGTMFGSFDMPLVMKPAGAGLPDAPNVNPLANVLGELTDAVESLVSGIKEEVDKVLAAAAAGDPQLFRAVMVTYLALPVLAFLSIAAAGGPAAAAALAAAVLLAAQELAHLLARLLSGPLQKQLREAKERVLETVGELQALFARQIADLHNPAAALELVSGHLLEIKNLLPEVFLDDAAALLGAGRRALADRATALGLAAERALGFENATAFDAVRPDYETGLSLAPQLPGGSDASRLAGAALLRDLHRLEAQRAGLLDGKEMEVTFRLSLSRLLGDTGAVVTAPPAAGFAEFLAAGQLLLRIGEGDLLDRAFPGLYRTLIQSIGVTGVFASGQVASPSGVPLTITHLGTARTRIRRGANPASPPVAPPPAAPLSATVANYAAAVLDRQELKEEVNALIDFFVTTVLQYQKTVGKGMKIEGPTIASQVEPFFTAQLPELMVFRMVRNSGGVIDVAAVREEARTEVTKILDPWWALLNDPAKSSAEWTRVTESTLTPPSMTFKKPSRDTTTRELEAQGIHDKLADSTALRQLMSRAASAAGAAAMAAAASAHAQAVGKWAGATLQEDRDPHVRSLGFVTLVQDLPPESAVFNLLPEPAAAAGALSRVPAAGFAQAPVSAARTLQYRPFENRGLDGEFLLTLGRSPAAGLPGDILLDVTVRGCFDEDLAATVRASGTQAATQFGLANAVALAAGSTLVYPGTLPDLDVGAAHVRTIHFSARAHRDLVLRNALAAAYAANPRAASPVVDGLAFDLNARPLGLHDPLTDVEGAAPSSLTLQFQQNPPANLGALESTLVVTPADLGILDPLRTAPVGGVVGLGIAIIRTPPTRGTKKGPAPPPAPPRITVDPVLASLLPVTGRLLLMTYLPQAPVWGDTLWRDASPVSVHVKFHDDGDDDRGGIYDVIFSVSIAPPVRATRTTPVTT